MLLIDNNLLPWQSTNGLYGMRQRDVLSVGMVLDTGSVAVQYNANQDGKPCMYLLFMNH